MSGLPIFLRLLVICGVAVAISCTPADERGPVILAPASMQEAMEALADTWEAAGEVRPVLSIAGTPAIARQAAEGAPADIIITADDAWMDWLEERGHISSASRRVVAGNSLVFVWSDMHLVVPGRPIVAEVDFAPRHIAMADPDTVPAGRYARTALQSAGLWDAISERIVPTENVRAALRLVEQGEADLGIVYASDLRAVPSLLSAPLSGGESVRVRYPAALATASRHPNAEALLEFFSAPEGSAIFCAHGFTAPVGETPC